MLISLIYGSTAAQPFSEAELIELLTTAKKNNVAKNITGMLLYRNQNFIQVLEGEADIVEALYARIQDDPRHQSVITIRKHRIEKRDFADWTMGFVNLESVSPKAIPGYTGYLTQPLEPQEFQSKPSAAYKFLQVFKEMIR